MNRKTRASFNHQLTFLTPKKRGRWAFAALAAMAAGVSFVLSREAPPTAIDLTGPASTPTPTAPAARVPQPAPVKTVEVDYVVKPGDTLGKIFTVLKIDVGELPGLLDVPAVRERFATLKPGDQLSITLKNDALHHMSRRINETEVLSVTRNSRGFAAKVVTTPVETKTVMVHGTISSSLFIAGRAVGLRPETLQQLATDIFGWDVDFALDIRAGDRFKVVYEQKYRAGEYLGDGHIVAAELVTRGETFRAVRYTSPDGKVDGYFTPDGESVRRRFVRAPLDFSRVQASADAERQPVITLVPEHQGIDYPAPIGTVVKAAGDGRIKFVGDRGAHGETVIIEHGDGIATLYGHLSGVAKGLEAGRHVRQGDTIGYVGNTGASTAPHLHYEYRVNGTYVDPRTVQLAPSTLPAQYRADFQSKSSDRLASLEQPGEAVLTALLPR